MYSRSFEDERTVVCPICFAPLYPRVYTKMMTCPYCGTLLILREKKAHIVKRKDCEMWYWFRSSILREGIVGILITTKHIIEVAEDGTTIVDGVPQTIEGELGETKYVWGEIPFIAIY